MADIIVAPEKLRAYEEAVFQHYGFSEDGAKKTANSLLEADLRGVSSHGAIRIPVYVSRIEHGVVETDGEPDLVVDTPAVAILDGHNTFGQITATKAMHLAMDKAEKCGIGCAGVRHSHHYGTAAYYAQMALERDMIGFSTTNTNPLMPVLGGKKRMIGNNPVSYAIPAGSHLPIVLDMACSLVAHGKISLALKRGEEIPLGWATDVDGNPTTDPAKAFKGFLSAMGGPKGLGLAMVMDLLSGPLVGSACGEGVSGLTGIFDRYQNCGHFFIAIDVKQFTDIDEFKKQVDDYIDYVKSSPTNDTVSGVYMPGEIEYGVRAKRLVEGVPLPETTIQELRELAEKIGLAKELWI